MTLRITVPDRYRRRLSHDAFTAVMGDVSRLADRLEARGPGLLARARETAADGCYPTSVRPGRRGGPAESTVPERLALAAAEDGERFDLVSELATGMCEALLVARDALRAAYGACEAVATSDGTAGNEGLVVVKLCIVCGGDAPRPRRGMDNACRMAWERAGQPDIAAFKHRRLAELAEKREAA